MKTSLRAPELACGRVAAVPRGWFDAGASHGAQPWQDTLPQRKGRET
jgi:hypothetical protein